MLASIKSYTSPYCMDSIARPSAGVAVDARLAVEQKTCKLYARFKRRVTKQVEAHPVHYRTKFERYKHKAFNSLACRVTDRTIALLLASGIVMGHAHRKLVHDGLHLMAKCIAVATLTNRSFTDEVTLADFDMQKSEVKEFFRFESCSILGYDHESLPLDEQWDHTFTIETVYREFSSMDESWFEPECQDRCDISYSGCNLFRL